MKSSRLYIYTQICRWLPETRFFKLKAKLLKWCGATVGNNVRISSSAIFMGTGNLQIGENTWIGSKCLIIASSNINIGSNCDIAPCVYIGNGTHEITPERVRIADIEISRDVVVGDGCWICANSTILPGVSIGDMCVVAAGSVVAKSFERYRMVGGVPATIKKYLREVQNT